MKRRAVLLLALGLVSAGCAALFGWDIHAPGVLSADFEHQIPRQNTRLALYIPHDTIAQISKDKGTRWSDPQTYHLGEAFVPMVVEAFQDGFEEFVLMETEPTPEIMRQYGIPYLAVVVMKDFRNRKDMKGQGLDVTTETTVFGPDLHLLRRFETTGSSDAWSVFAKKGGPEVNMNAAIESNLRSVVVFLQDWIAQRGAAA